MSGLNSLRMRAHHALRKNCTAPAKPIDR
jgi:hypothetical protein